MTDFQSMDANLVAQPIASFQNPDGSYVLLRSSEHRKPTFRYAGNYTPVAAPTDSILIEGSATRTLRIKRIALGGLATTAGSMPVTLVRRTTQYTTVGSAVFNIVGSPGRHDPNDANATGVVATVGTANITSLGTPAGNLGQGRLWLPLVTAQPFPLVFDFATRQDKALILRGIVDFLYINFGGAAVPSGGSIDYEIEIEEDQT